jgi:uncharacterized protein
MIPASLKNFNVIFDGTPLTGLAEEVVLPKLTRKMDDYQGGGMLGPVSLDMGLDAMALEITFAEFQAIVLKSWGVLDVSGINVRFMGAAYAEDSQHTVQAIEVSVRGRLKEIDKGTAKRGDRSKMKTTMPLTYFKYSVNGEPYIEIDLIAGTEIVGGVDRAAAVRSALGTSA